MPEGSWSDPVNSSPKWVGTHWGSAQDEDEASVCPQEQSYITSLIPSLRSVPIGEVCSRAGT